ncbi:hypothetical protein [Sedimentitalea todarodis]|uniref:Dihydroorotate dehydrogenase n=1 Tax=Sedimentitalea todarodis TaxID=1631240 RepID=A0ABU3VLU5_9RHOB|nr:hypothetical protein [Sedimentitalea todarodis]MDU9007145.1 hypothetical protein [Sedimentitalea todarodis]
MTDTDKEMIELDVFFEAARRETAEVPDGLADRIVADADRVRQSWSVSAQKLRPGILRQLYDMLGGWPAMGGLATACAAGVWLGFSPPSMLPDPAQFVMVDGTFLDDDSLATAMAEEG